LESLTLKGEGLVIVAGENAGEVLAVGSLGIKSSVSAKRQSGKKDRSSGEMNGNKVRRSGTFVAVEGL
jgi:hypothetical protein